MREVIDLERERSRASQRAAILNEIWLHGLPDGMPLAQIQVLLGDQPTATSPDGQPQTWKALPSLENDNADDKFDDGNDDHALE